MELLLWPTCTLLIAPLAIRHFGCILNLLFVATKQKTELKIMSLHTPDLTKHPPRSPRARLGGYVILPRMLDKGRATLAGKNGEYHYACPLDQRFLEFAGIDPEALKMELGKGDGEILEWVQKNAKHKHNDA